MNGTPSTRTNLPGTLRTIARVLIAATAAMGIVACGGGGGSDATGSAANNNAPANSTVIVTVTDALGAPVGGANVHLDVTRSDVNKTFFYDTDASGTVVARLQPQDLIRAFATDERIAYSRGWSKKEALLPNLPTTLAITVLPANEFTTLGVAAPALVEASSVAGDGRSLEFSLQLIRVPSGGGGWFDLIYAPPGGGGLTGFREYDDDHITLNGCAPDTSNDATAFEADCIRGPDGFDAGYQDANSGEPISLTTPTVLPSTFSAALLLDQSRNTVDADPTDARLFDAKYFLTTKRAADRVVLAAFAADDEDTSFGEFSSLPQQPVSIFPIENPQFTTSSNGLFPTLDSLNDLEGGAPPLFASIDRMLDFTAANAPISTRRAVVVLTDGRDDTCDTPTPCQAGRQALMALIAKSRATGVAIVTLGLAVSPLAARAISELAEGSGGAALFADSPQQLGSLFGVLAGVLDGSGGRDRNLRTMRFRIVSETDAFKSGRTVLGTVHFKTCPWDCKDYDIPFAVQIP